MEPQKIIIRAIVHMIGKPKEHLEQIIRDYVQELKKEDGVKVLKEDYADAEEKEEKHMFSIFVELEIEFRNVDKLMWFCFDYMPSSIEILSPDKFVYDANHFTSFLNELQGKMHKLDMLIKNFEADNKVLKKNGLTLLKNLIIVLLKEKTRDINEISKEAGVPAAQIEKFLQAMEQEGKIREKNGKYELMI
ncbi:hypothetical protein J4434_06305 [Candidatus Woesearchaeota archaeon]|nr:hypothetical protein [Candidatus Woesearchaeota archaeon]